MRSLDRAGRKLLGPSFLIGVLVFAAGLPAVEGVRAEAGLAPTEAETVPVLPGVFAETGFRVADERFAAYFEARGGVETFGYPISRRFFLDNTLVQVFQRHVMQLYGDGQVSLLDLLHPEVFPYTSFGGLTVPAASPELIQQAPPFGTPDFADLASLFIARQVLNHWEDLPVGFLDAFLAPGRAAGEADPLMQVLIGLEIYGFPTSQPSRDPNNDAFVYQRFDRGVFQFNAATGKTQPLLLGEYFKALLTGRGLPSDLRSQASDSRYYQQYSPARPRWIVQPELMPASDLSGAFETEDRMVKLPLPTLLGGPGSAVPFSQRSGSSPSVPRLPGLAGLMREDFSSGQTGALMSAGNTTPTATPTATPPSTATPQSVQSTPTQSPTPNAQPPDAQGTEPGSAAVGQDILIRGKGFGTESGQVIFTGKIATAQIWTDTFIAVTVPEGAKDGVIRVRRPDGAISNPIGFAPATTPVPTAEPPTATPTVEPTQSPTPTPGTPTLNEVNPSRGVPNSTFLLYGKDFGRDAGQVLLGNHQAPVESGGWSDTSIVAKVPSEVRGSSTERVFVRRASDGKVSGFKCYQVVEPTPTTLAGTSTPTPAATPTVATSC